MKKIPKEEELAKPEYKETQVEAYVCIHFRAGILLENESEAKGYLKATLGNDYDISDMTILSIQPCDPEEEDDDDDEPWKQGDCEV